MTRNNKKEFFIYILTLCYLIPFGFLIAFNTLFSMLQTTYMELYLDTEKPLYKADSPLLLCLLLLIFIVLCGFYFKKRPITKELCKKMEKSVLIYASLLCLFFILIFRARTACDSQALSEIAIAFLNNDYSSFTGDGYLVHYPHQLGMIGYLQIIYFLFGVENFIVLQLLNTVAIISTVYFLHRIIDELFDDLTISFLFSLLCFGLLPLYLYATFIYGDIPGLGLVVPSIYYTIRYQNTGKRLLILPASLCMAFSIILKSNNMVILVASVIMLILRAWKARDKFAILFAIVMFLLPNIGTSCIDSYYAHVAGIEEIPAGIPKIAWIAMGLQENEYLENGWYNSYNWTTYTNTGYDAEKTTELCMESIKASVASFIEAPRSTGLQFFYKKFISQWNHPDYHAMLTNEWYSRHRDDHSGLAISLIYEKGRFLLDEYMNIYHFIILFGTAVFAFHSLRKWTLSRAYFSLCVFGGYFFHMLWEAKARYALGYFVLCIPMAAYGIRYCIQFVQLLLEKLKNKAPVASK